jgi:hypothetical protein
MEKGRVINYRRNYLISQVEQNELPLRYRGAGNIREINWEEGIVEVSDIYSRKPTCFLFTESIA